MGEAATAATGAGLGWKIAGWSWDHRETILKRLTGVFGWFREHQGKDILVLGAGGIGKSTLGRLLCGEYHPLFDAGKPYEESIGVETLYATEKTKGKQRPDSIIIPPGQQHRREATWTEHLRGITEGKFRGVIVLSSFGYHTLGDISYKTHKLYKSDDSAGFLERYLADRQAEEVKIITEVVRHVAMNTHPMWLLSVVTKQDLWWPYRVAVEDFYSTGKYGGEIQKLLNQKDKKSFRHELAMSSLVISNFVTGVNETLQLNTAGYDDKEKTRSLRRLIETIDALRAWEPK